MCIRDSILEALAHPYDMELLRTSDKIFEPQCLRMTEVFFRLWMVLAFFRLVMLVKPSPGSAYYALEPSSGFTYDECSILQALDDHDVDHEWSLLQAL